ncbi:MAG: hypothetical protein U5K00_18300 [Melioribacteraceae bacterium]|nr:hypothetical protein [Melioribacteraceae bacterium]
MEKFESIIDDWIDLIEISFLSETKKEEYMSLLGERKAKIFS